MVTRHKCTGEQDDAPINGHMGNEAEFNLKGKTLSYFDENSLYGSAVSIFIVLKRSIQTRSSIYNTCPSISSSDEKSNAEIFLL